MAKFRMKPSTFIILVLLVIIVIVYVSVVSTLKVKNIAAAPTTTAFDTSSLSSVTWPTYGQAAIGAKGYGVITTKGNQTGVPIASIAKIMLAYSILTEKPLNKGDNGPIITITAQDEALYKSALAQNGSVVPVQQGSDLTEYQALQALLLPSGNNIADTLANWAFGSIDKYTAYANNNAQKMGLTATHFADASGISPQTVSSAADLVTLGETATENPVLADIVSQTQATIPVAGNVKNVDRILGTQGINGIKTGNTTEAGGCFLFSAQTTINNKEVTLVGAILGATDLNTVLKDTLTFLSNNTSTIKETTIVAAGQTVGNYKTPWGTSVEAVSKNDITALVSKDANVTIKPDFHAIQSHTAKDTGVGTLNVTVGSKTYTSPIILKDAVSKPPFFWRLLHP